MSDSGINLDFDRARRLGFDEAMFLAMVPHMPLTSDVARHVGDPVAIVDIGSNSVRLVAYEGLTRALTPIFNDKVLAGLGRGVKTTGKLPQDGVDKALAALKRFRALCDIMEISDVHVIATAAARDAANGKAFLSQARDAIGAPIELISGKREAELGALGVVCGFHRPDGVSGDMGGGSLELNEVRGHRLGRGVTLPLGGLSLTDLSGKSPKRAVKIVREALADCKPLHELKGRTFYAIGGTWRSLARLHMRQRSYPLNVMHGYTIPARDAADFAALVERLNVEALIGIDSISDARRPLLAYGAVVLEEIIRRARPRDIVVSALGVREGLLYSLLDAPRRNKDALMAAARELNTLRSRSPLHGEELIDWTDAFMASAGIGESADEMRLRHAACLLADIGWRAHPDYRGEQSLNIIAHAAFVGIDHPGRAYLALAIFFRHVGLLRDEELSPRIRELASTRMLDRARVLGAAFRVAYMISASQPGVLPRAPLKAVRNKLVLRLRGDCAALAGDRVSNRLKQLARLVGREPVVVS